MAAFRKSVELKMQEIEPAIPQLQARIADIATALQESADTPPIP